MADIRSACAIGRDGQIGLRGRLPWEGHFGELFRHDVARFWELTRGHVLIAGPATYASIPDAAKRDRTIVELRSHEPPEVVLARFAGRVVFVGGGVAVWNAYAPYITHWDITRLPYDGEADRFFDPAWLAPSNSVSATSRPME